MMATDTDTPIVVGGMALPTALASALRYLITMLGTFAVAKGWVKAENLDGILTVAITLATVGYGLYKSYTNRTKLITTAEAAPNSVAIVTK
jgi:hypothetical protein